MRPELRKLLGLSKTPAKQSQNIIKYDDIIDLIQNSKDKIDSDDKRRKNAMLIVSDAKLLKTNKPTELYVDIINNLLPMGKKQDKSSLDGFKENLSNLLGIENEVSKLEALLKNVTYSD